MDIEAKIDAKIERILEELSEQGRTLAVQEQKIREINHRMGDGQQRNVLSHETLKMEIMDRFEKMDGALSAKVDLEDYKETLAEMRKALEKHGKHMVTISWILVLGSGAMANMETIRKLIAQLLGFH